MANSSKFKLDKNYNILFLAAFGVVSVIAINSIVRYYKRKNKSNTTPISDAIKSIKSGEIKTTQIPDKI